MNEETYSRFSDAYWRAMRDLDAVRMRQWELSHLTLPQLRVLFFVRRNPGATTVQLSRALGVTASTISGLVTKLVEAGLLERGTTAGDRRRLPLSLTDAGADLAGELAEEGRHFLRQTAERLGASLERVTGALEQLTEASAQTRDVSRGETS